MLHQPMHVIENTIGRKRDVAVLRHHYLNLYAALYGLFQRPLQRGVERKVRVHQLYAVLCAVNGLGVERPYYGVSRARLTVDYAYHLTSGRAARVGLQSRDVVGAAVTAEILGPVHVLARHLVPYFQEYSLQRVHLVALYAAVHVAPLSHFLRTGDVIVGHVHSARIGNLSVNYDNLAVVAVEHMVNPREAYRVELVNLNAL